MSSTARQDTLERMIDQSTLADILEDIAIVCCAKAAHIENNWQDVQLSRVWQSAASRIGKLAVKLPV